MSARVMPGTESRNGLPDFRDYAYGAGPRKLRPAVGGERQDRARKGQPGVSGRVLAALAGRGGEASTTELRTDLELDGGPPFSPSYLIQVLTRLSRRDPPAVIPAGRESGSGRARRWQLGPGAACGDES